MKKDKIAELYDNLGLSTKQTYDEVKEVIDEARKTNPCLGDDLASLLTGDWFFSKDPKSEEAINHYKCATNSNMYNSEAFRKWGNVYFSREEYEQAIKKYKLSTECNKNNTLSFHNWGVALFMLNRYEEACKAFQSATECDKSNDSSFYNWGVALFKLNSYEKACMAFQNVISINDKHISALNNWGVALINLRCYKEALEKYEKIIEYDKDDPYAYHNIAEIYWRQGNYPESLAWWKDAVERYRIAKKNKDSKFFKAGDDFQNLGDILREYRGELEEAETVYCEGLALYPEHIGILSGLVILYQQIIAICGCSKCRAPSGDDFWSIRGRDKDFNTQHCTIPKFKDTRADYVANPDLICLAAYEKAYAAFTKAEGILRSTDESKKNVGTYLQLAHLQILMEEYEEAERSLKTTSTLRQKEDMGSAETIANKLGIIYLHKEKYSQAVQYFLEALNMDRTNIPVRNNLAETYLRAGLLEKAEEEYASILRITPFHVESHIGLGQVYIAMGDKGDAEQFDHARRHLKKSLDLGNSKNGSKRLVGRDKAAVHYARGYASVKLYESSKLFKEESLLNGAITDFRVCTKLDRKHHKAQRILDKLEKRFKCFSPQRILETYGPWLVSIFSFLVFVFAQLGIFWPVFKAWSDSKHYFLLTFGSLLFLVAGLSLPNILKLKMAGIEMEKSTVDQIKIVESFVAGGNPQTGVNS